MELFMLQKSFGLRMGDVFDNILGEVLGNIFEIVRGTISLPTIVTENVAHRFWARVRDKTG